MRNDKILISADVFQKERFERLSGSIGSRALELMNSRQMKLSMVCNRDPVSWPEAIIPAAKQMVLPPSQGPISRMIPEPVQTDFPNQYR